MRHAVLLITTLTLISSSLWAQTRSQGQSQATERDVCPCVRIVDNEPYPDQNTLWVKYYQVQAGFYRTTTNITVPSGYVLKTIPGNLGWEVVSMRYFDNKEEATKEMQRIKRANVGIHDAYVKEVAVAMVPAG